jgi:hypothetical protein
MSNSKGVKKKHSFGDELSDIAKVLSGELELRKREEEVDRMMKKAVQKQKDLRREGVIKGNVQVKSEDGVEEVRKVVQKKKIFEWDSPIRFKQPFEQRTFLIVTGLMLLFIMYLAVLGHYGLMASIIALLFLFYVAGTTPPITVTHQINTKGIETLDTLYEWFMLDSFWFSERKGEYMLAVETKLRYPGRLIMLVDRKDIKPLFLLLQDKLLYKDIKKWGKIDSMNFGEYLPIEDISK